MSKIEDMKTGLGSAMRMTVSLKKIAAISGKNWLLSTCDNNLPNSSCLGKSVEWLDERKKIT